MSHLPELYLITPDYTGNRRDYIASLKQTLQDGIKLIQWRSKHTPITDYIKIGKELANITHAYGAKLLLNSAIDLLEPVQNLAKLDKQGCIFEQRSAENAAFIARLVEILNSLLNDITADGIHLTSSTCMALAQRPITTDYLLSAACHDAIQLQQANLIQADLVIISPIFATSTSPHGKPLGWEKFAELAKQTSLPVYALGGLTTKDYWDARRLGAHGIAGIRGLWRSFIPQPQ